LNVVNDVLGEYAGAAARGLLTSTHGDDKHPTEIADLQGKRLVTASESDAGADLREGFLKWITGDDPLKARRMYQDLFEFRPTHKLQLLTNHKPTIKGQDFGIWRRLLLVWYTVSYGSEDDIAQGRAARLSDKSLTDTLRTQREGIFAWLVRGAKEWYRDGLKAPETVLAAGRDYQREQDRIGQFVAERCILDPKSWSPFDGAMSGLYPHYSQWCRESGYQALGKTKFSQELERVVPAFRRAQQKRVAGGVRRSVWGCYGLHVDPDGMGDEVIQENKHSCLTPSVDDVADLIGNIEGVTT
jgi:putative DNA primase/helicase